MELLQRLPDIDFATLDLLPYGIIVTDVDGVILYYNSHEEKLSGLQKEDVIGRNFFSEVAPCTHLTVFQTKFLQVTSKIESQMQFRFEFPFPDNHREVHISLSSFLHRNRPMCIIAVDDITEEQRLREQMLKAERFREIGEVAASVVHNFNNMLSVVRGYSQLLVAKDDADAETRKCATDILKVSEDGIAMIKRITSALVDDKRDNREKEVVDLQGVVRDCLDLSKSYRREVENRCRKSIQVQLVETNPPFWVSAFSNELREVVLNLLRNALDAVCSHSLEANSISYTGLVQVCLQREDGCCSIEVKDNGCGMSADVQNKLFVPMFTTKGSLGTGLGLYSSYSIIHRHGGTLEVKSSPGRGSTFAVQIPSIQQP